MKLSIWILIIAIIAAGVFWAAVSKSGIVLATVGSLIVFFLGMIIVIFVVPGIIPKVARMIIEGPLGNLLKNTKIPMALLKVIYPPSRKK